MYENTYSGKRQFFSVSTVKKVKKKGKAITVTGRGGL
jgi:hypothetical protein